MILVKLYICISFILVSNAQSLFRPNLPFGQFRLVIKAIRQCENTNHLPLQARLYLNKKSSKITEFMGNFTVGISFDDSLIVDANIESWSLTGGWKPNSNVYVTNNACSKSKSFIAGNSWYTFTKAFNVPTGNCPIPVGTYSTLGYDTSLLEDNHLPKLYFYGKYKFVAKVKTKDNKLIGCIAYEIEVLRPWDTDI